MKFRASEGKMVTRLVFKTLDEIIVTLDIIMTNNESFIKVTGLEKIQAWSVA